MATSPNKTRVKAGHVSLPLYRHPKGWRWAWKDPATGRWRYGTRVDRKKALAEAFQQALRLASQQAGIAQALEDPATANLIGRFLAGGFTHQDLDLLERALTERVTHHDLDQIAALRHAEIHPFGQVAEQFMAAKEGARGRSRRNIRSLRGHVDAMKARFGLDRPIADITIADLEAYIHQGTTSPRTRKNRRGTAVTLWRWARARRLLPDETTAAERTERPIVPKSVPATWTPAELATMWAVCPASHRPWLALTAWSGVRVEECYQEDPLSGKDVIRWRDVFTGHLEIRPEVAKTERRRIIPICPTLAAFLAEERSRRADEPDTAPVCPGRPPSRDLPVINRAPTIILGEAVGGWKANALRHSFISYRAVQIGLARTALEAGNSEAEARRSYHDAMTDADATAWFSPFGTSSELKAHPGEDPEGKIISIR